MQPRGAEGQPDMSDADECRSQAVQCFRLAATASTPLQRDVLLNAATVWMTLANQADRDLAWRKLQDARQHEFNRLAVD
jgi:hypothetical protein